MIADGSPLFASSPNGYLDLEKKNSRIGIIDIGSNTIRMVIYDAPARLPIPIFNERVVCRLGKGIGKTGRLNHQGKGMAFEALDRFCGLAREMSVEHFRIVATAAVRDSEDGTEFAREIEERFGYVVNILSGDEEARLGATGILGGLPDADGLFGDMGGGSLDLMLLNLGRFGQSSTLPLGHLRITEAAEGSFEIAQRLIEAQLAKADWLSQVEGRNFYAVGGVWRAIARIYIQQNNYPLHIIDNLSVDVKAVRHLTQVISHLSSKSLQGMSGVASRRADTLPFAALVMNRLLKVARPKQLIFSGYGLREGQFFDLLSEEMKCQDPLISACQGFARRGGRFSLHGEEIANWIKPILLGASAEDIRILQAAALLSDIGWTEHPDYRALHSFIRILRLPIAGITHRERIMLALVIFVRYNGRRRQYEVQQVRPLLEDGDQCSAAIMGLALRLAHVLSAGIPGLLTRVTLTTSDKGIILDLRDNQHLFKSEAVKKILGQLTDMMDVEFLIK